MKRFAFLALLALVACGPVGGERYTRKKAQASLGKLETPGTTVGEFRVTKVTDGDTIHVDGLDSSLRLVGIDTEEIFHNEKEKRRFESQSWESYLKDMRGSSKHPVKMGTPMGEKAWQWAQKFFDGVERVRIERDHPAEIRDRYQRYLAYVIANKNGVWLNYNVEAVRAGMAPYFTKYGYSRKYHKEFVAAEAEAKAAKRGIWAPGEMAYPDYAERETWWTARAEFIEEFRKEAEGKTGYIDVTHWDAQKELEANLGKEVHVLGTIDRVDIAQGKAPSRATMSFSRPFSSLPLIFFDNDVLGTSGVNQWRGEFVVVTGVPTMYENKRTHKKQLQIVIERASQIKLSKVPGASLPTANP